MPSPTTTLSFAAFGREVLGGRASQWTPYPWQVRLAERCANPDAEPPAWVIAPTGAGKTAAIDCLVWALAQQADLPATRRTAATRIVWAIDRRLLVDEVHEHASALADRLDDALDAGCEDPLHGIALRLYRLAAADRDAAAPPREERVRLGLRPLAVQRWRGGISRREQLHAPFQPQIITSTVAQIGSRLLFRGYGVGEASLQVAAGLATTDVTLCLDEAHLALPFLETATAIKRFRDGGELDLPPLNVLTLTATPPVGLDRDRTVELDEADRSQLGKRWRGQKRLELREESTQPEKMLTEGVRDLFEDGGRLIACVVNRVQTARNVHRSLEKILPEEFRLVLLIGPQRPADREKMLAGVRSALFEGNAPEQPIVVVATQTIEVGLDADFDAMVTQSASASALTQRLGRLNRSGNRPGRCIIVRDTKSFLYEQDEPRAWRWLSGRPGSPDAIDVSSAALFTDGSRPADVAPPLAATLTTSMVNQLSQTSPRPAPLADPAIDPLLSGIGAEQRVDVQVAWRRDLRFSLEEEEPSARLRTYREALLLAAPPEPNELLSLSIGDARRLLGGWLADPTGSRVKRAVGDGTDIEGGDPGEKAAPGPAAVASFVVVRGREVLHGSREERRDERFVTLRQLVPGDTIVVPTALDLDSERAVPGPGPCDSDAMADRASPPSDLDGQTRFALRLSWDALTPRSPSAADRGHPPQPQQWLELAKALHEHSSESSSRSSISVDLLRAWLGASAAALPARYRAWLDALEDNEVPLRLRRVTVTPAVDVLMEEEIASETLGEAEEPDEPLEDLHRRIEDHPLFDQAWVLTRGRPVEKAEQPPATLAEHSEAVRARAARFGSWLGLPKGELRALELAALAHDIGKCDPRFQDFLYGGDAAGREPIAKSVFGTENWAAARAAAERAALPSRFRHEAASVAILASALAAGAIPEGLTASEQSLALFLVGSHHGRGMPLWRVEGGGGPAIAFEADLLGVTGSASGSNSAAWLDGQWLQQLTALQDRYGHWGLAYLSALLALTDRTVSREGS